MKPYNTQFDTVGYYPTKSYIILPNTKISCRCAEPVIIINHSLKRNHVRLSYIHVPHYHTALDACYINNYYKLHKLLYSYKDGVTYDNINEYYVVTNDGEIMPIFVLVPCNKCFICLDRKSKMWQFRGIAESNYSNNNTYFITLTYNNEFKPYKGVNKYAIQLFMKRLRHRLDKLNIPHKIKYFACGEYGKHTLRPHYHLVLWHFPDDNSYFKNITSIIRFIEKSWSVYDFNSQKHIQIGYAQCQICDSGSLRYVMKYVRKKGRKPEHSNDTFFCCSKFIGIDYLLDNYEYLKMNPTLLSLEINDITRGDTFSSPFPDYYKNKISPTFSKFFPKEVVDSFQFLLYLHRNLLAIQSNLTFNSYKCPDSLAKLYKLYYDSDINSCGVDDYLFHRYSRYSEEILLENFDRFNVQAQIYNTLLNNYISNINLDDYFLANEYLCKRSSYLSMRPLKYTLDSLRIENEKLERWRQHEIDKEQFI